MPARWRTGLYLACKITDGVENPHLGRFKVNSVTKSTANVSTRIRSKLRSNEERNLLRLRRAVRRSFSSRGKIIAYS